MSSSAGCAALKLFVAKHSASQSPPADGSSVPPASGASAAGTAPRSFEGLLKLDPGARLERRGDNKSPGGKD